MLCVQCFFCLRKFSVHVHRVYCYLSWSTILFVMYWQDYFRRHHLPCYDFAWARCISWCVVLSGHGILMRFSELVTESWVGMCGRGQFYLRSDCKIMDFVSSVRYLTFSEWVWWVCTVVVTTQQHVLRRLEKCAPIWIWCLGRMRIAYTYVQKGRMKFPYAAFKIAFSLLVWIVQGLVLNGVNFSRKAVPSAGRQCMRLSRKGAKVGCMCCVGFLAFHHSSQISTTFSISDFKRSTVLCWNQLPCKPNSKPPLFCLLHTHTS